MERTMIPENPAPGEKGSPACFSIMWSWLGSLLKFLKTNDYITTKLQMSFQKPAQSNQKFSARPVGMRLRRTRSFHEIPHQAIALPENQNQTGW
jgi:hypothetical protein